MPHTSSLSTTNFQLSTIVIPMVSGIGNALMTEPMVRQLRAALPGARIVVVAINRAMGDVLARVGGIECVVTGAGVKNMLRSIRVTRAMSPDAYVVPFPSNRWQYNALAAASGAKRVVIHSYPTQAFSIKRFERVGAQRGIHDVIQNLRLLPALGIVPNETDSPRYPVTDAERERADTIFREHKLPEKFVVVHAGSAKTILAEAKRWPVEQYAKLVQQIVKDCSLPVVIVEGPDETGVGEAILGYCNNRNDIHLLPLRGALGDSAAVLERSSFYVGTDSGLAHLASAVGRAAVTLFAPADPDRVCPFGQRHLVVQPPGMTEPSFLYPWESTKPRIRPGHIDDIKRITVDQVMQKVLTLLVPSPSGLG